AGGTLDLEIVAVIKIERCQRANQQHVHRHPDWATPIRIPAKHTGVRFSWKVIHSVFLPVDVENVGMVSMESRQRPDTIRTEKFILIEHARQYPPQPILIY